MRLNYSNLCSHYRFNYRLREGLVHVPLISEHRRIYCMLWHGIASLLLWSFERTQAMVLSEIGMAATSTESVGNSGGGLPKWQIALALGTPVALGFAYWYIRSKSSNASSQSGGGGKKNKSKQNYGAKSPGDDVVRNNKATKSKNALKNKSVDEGLLSKDPLERAKAYKVKGNGYFKDKNFEKAIECYSEAISICPPAEQADLSMFYQNRAAAYENLKKYEEVVKDCTKAIELNRKYIKALQRRAKAHEVLGNLQQALEDITAVCLLENYDNPGSVGMTDKVLKQLGKEKAKQLIAERTPVLASRQFINHYFQSFCEDPCVVAAEKYTLDNKSPNDLTGYRLALYHFANQQYEEVMPACNVEIDRNGPDYPEALLCRGTFFLLRGQVDEAAEDFNRLLAMDGIDVKVRVNALIKAGTLKVQEEQLEEALQMFQRAIELDPNNADIYLHRGQLYLLMERSDDTLRDLEKSASLNPNFPLAIAQKCYVQYRCGIRFNDLAKRNEALEGFEEAQKQFPNSSDVFCLHAQVLSEEQEYEKADELFSLASKADPKDANILVHRGILRLHWDQNIDEAVKFCESALKVDDRCQFAYEMIGSIEVQRGNPQKGIEHFDKAIEQALTEMELAHLISLREATATQIALAKQWGQQQQQQQSFPIG